MPEPIKVIISDETGREQVEIGTGGPAPNENVSNKQVKANDKNNMIAAAGTYAAMRTLSFVTSNIGKYTGDQRLQSNINKAKQISSYGVAFATNVYLGAALVALDGASSFADYMWERKWDEIRSQVRMTRNGDLGGFRR